MTEKEQLQMGKIITLTPEQWRAINEVNYEDQHLSEDEEG